MTQRKRVDDESGRKQESGGLEVQQVKLGTSPLFRAAAKSDFRGASLEPPHFMSPATQGQGYREDT
jgi:hypothetical protein